MARRIKELTDIRIASTQNAGITELGSLAITKKAVIKRLKKFIETRIFNALEVIEEIMNDERVDPKWRLLASKMILELGIPKQQLEVKETRYVSPIPLEEKKVKVIKNE